MSTIFTYGGSNVTTTDGTAHAAHAFIGDVMQAGTATTTTVSYSTSVQIGGVLKSEDIPYMRSREVQFSVKGLKPSTEMFPFFDNTSVGAYCKAGSSAYGAPMITDEKGNLNGTFNIPNTTSNRFRTGTKRFTLNDNTKNVKETSLSYADADYTAVGTLNTVQRTIVTTAVVTTVTVPWDPLAQSFFVEKDGGVFLTSIEVFFASKDAATGITMQIRNMDNGTPGQEVVPYSTVTLNPEEVSVSTTATVGTKFKFPSPVYLQDGSDFCFVLMSNSDNYNVYIGTMGHKIIGSNAYISKQPYIGVLFKSQNNITWTEDQTSDIKFNINIAKFETNTVKRATFTNKIANAINLSSNPLISTVGTKSVIANIRNHGLFVGSKFMLSGVDVAPGIPLSELNKLQTVVEVVNSDSIKFETTSNAITTGSFGGALVHADRNILIDTVFPRFQELLFDDTKVDWSIDGTTGKSLSGIETPYVVVPTSSIVPNKTSDLPYPFMVASQSEQSKLSRYSLGINADMSTFMDNISPVIDINRISVIGINNIINKPSVLNETAATGGNALQRYMTKVIDLKTPANSLRLYLDMNKPQGSEVYVFYRTGNSEEELNSKVWNTLPAITSVAASDANTYNEAEYLKDSIASFGHYQFKIVCTSSSSSVIPKIKRLRGIALGT